jgi:hypothetical protein
LYKEILKASIRLARFAEVLGWPLGQGSFKDMEWPGLGGFDIIKVLDSSFMWDFEIFEFEFEF